MKKIRKVGVTETVQYLVESYAKARGLKAEVVFNSLASAVASIKKGRYNVDTSDNTLSFNRIPLSIIRDWNKGEALILTNGEALALDNGERIVTYIKMN